MPGALEELHARRAYECRLTPDRALETLTDVVGLLGAALRAAVLAPDKDLVRRFSWRWLLPADLPDQLLDRGLAVRPGRVWLAAPSQS
jgi:hypothetical protein